MKLKHELKLKQLIPAIALPLAVGAAAGFLTKDGMAMFAVINKPPLSPPGWLFPVVWTLLYIMMGTASALVWSAPVSPARRDRALTVYSLSLVANFLWPLIFFGANMYLLALIWLVVLWVLIFFTIRAFSKINERAGDLLIPYILWVTFAAYLNLGIYLLN